MPSTLTQNSDREVLTASPTEVGQARQVIETLSREDNARPTIETRHGDTVALPRELSEVVTRILTILSAGGTVTVGSMPEALTTTAAASVLGVSRPTLMKMIARGEIKSYKVGSHSRLHTADVLAARATRRAKQRVAFDALRALEDDDS